MTSNHLIHFFENGTASVEDTRIGETMHSSVGPAEEARLIYIEQSELRDRLQRPNPSALVIYDIGMGLASNSLAAIDVASNLALSSSHRPLRIISFENDLDGIRLALTRPELFPGLVPHRAKVDLLLQQNAWSNEDGSIRWELKTGDFRDHRLSPAPELIFFDFYSPKSNPDLWSIEIFKRLKEACGSGESNSTLLTYSVATRIRAALLLSGFFVGSGISTSMKSETTVATTRISDLEKPLGREWLDKLARSQQARPAGIDEKDWPDALERIRQHPQFTTGDTA